MRTIIQNQSKRVNIKHRGQIFSLEPTFVNAIFNDCSLGAIDVLFSYRDKTSEKSSSW